MSNKEAPLLLTVREVSILLRVQRPKVYDLIKDGAVDGFKVGADWRVRRDSIERLIGAIPEDFFEKNNVTHIRDVVYICSHKAERLSQMRVFVYMRDQQTRFFGMLLYQSNV